MRPAGTSSGGFPVPVGRWRRLDALTWVSQEKAARATSNRSTCYRQLELAESVIHRRRISGSRHHCSGAWSDAGVLAPSSTWLWKGKLSLSSMALFCHTGWYILHVLNDELQNGASSKLWPWEGDNWQIMCTDLLSKLQRMVAWITHVPVQMAINLRRTGSVDSQFVPCPIKKKINPPLGPWQQWDSGQR
jgi:hypothetical protein